MTKFKDALDAVNDGVLRGSDINEIRLALKIADAVTGEISKEAITKGGELLWTRVDDTQDLDDRDIADTFRAMIEQMMREIGEYAGRGDI